MMQSVGDNKLARILFIVFLPLAFFACGEESDYLLDGGMSYEAEEALGPGDIGSNGDTDGDGGTMFGQICCLTSSNSCSCSHSWDTLKHSCGKDSSGNVPQSCQGQGNCKNIVEADCKRDRNRRPSFSNGKTDGQAMR